MRSRLTIVAFLAVLALGVGIYATTTLGQSGRRIATRSQPEPQPTPSAETTPSFSTEDVAPSPAPVGHAPSPSSVAKAAGPIAWKSSFSSAKGSAKPGQLIFVDVYTEWCGWCKYMDQRVYTDAAVQQFASDNVFVKLNAEDGAEGEAFAREVGVHGYPTLLVYTKDGQLIGQQPGAFRQARDFVSWLHSTSSHR